MIQHNHSDATWLLEPIRAIHEEIRAEVLRAFERSHEQMSEVASDGPGDTIYAVDRISESMLVELFEKRIAQREPIILIAEGLPNGKVTIPQNTAEAEAVWRVLADPIDGTRGLMYQKRSGWILTGVAPNRGDATTLADITLAVQTEIPTIKQYLCDTFWAFQNAGARGERFNRITGERSPLTPAPSRATNLSHGFATVARFFAGGRDVLAAIDDDVHFALLGKGSEGKALGFEDQYLSTGGQLYELMMGHDRFIADLRPLLRPVLKQRGLFPGLCCHPYDLCTELVAREAGVIVADENGKQLHSAMNVEADVSWIGYANHELFSLIQPLLQSAIERHGLSTYKSI